VTAIGADRPGIIARVTAVLRDAGGNLEDSSMTILGGHFAILLLVEVDAEPDALESRLAEATADLGLVVAVRPLGAGADSPPATHVLSVYGADRPGIVAEATAALAERGVNVTDLTTRVLDGERSVYAMLLEVALPPAGSAAQALAADLRRALEGVEVSVSELDVTTF